MLQIHKIGHFDHLLSSSSSVKRNTDREVPRRLCADWFFLRRRTSGTGNGRRHGKRKLAGRRSPCIAIARQITPAEESETQANEPDERRTCLMPVSYRTLRAFHFVHVSRHRFWDERWRRNTLNISMERKIRP